MVSLSLNAYLFLQLFKNPPKPNIKINIKKNADKAYNISLNHNRSGSNKI